MNGSSELGSDKIVKKERGGELHWETRKGGGGKIQAALSAIGFFLWRSVPHTFCLKASLFYEILPLWSNKIILVFAGRQWRKF